jgi:hypothetical protein
MTKFERAYIPHTEIKSMIAALKEKPPEFFREVYGMQQELTREVIDQLIEHSIAGQIFKNDTYQVQIMPVPKSEDWPEMVQLSIKRLDREPIHDWRELQTIKNELVGPYNEAVELYPSEQRIVDTANQYFLYCLTDPEISFPFGIVPAKPVRTDAPLHKAKNRKFHE